MLYNAIGAGEVTALRNLANVNIGVGAFAWNIQEAQGFGCMDFKALSSKKTLFFSLIN
jgi:hypothetical protein